MFSSQVDPACGPSIRQAMGPVFASWHKRLGTGLDRLTLGGSHERPSS